MIYNEKLSHSTPNIIQQICKVFSDPQNPNNVDLNKLREYVQKDKDINDTHIFKRKLNWFNKYNTINKQDFQKHFHPYITNTDHFNMVFDELDRNHNGKISKQQLQFYNKQKGLNLNKNDIDLMINFASRNGQNGLKVAKEDLYEFINSGMRCQDL